MYEDKNVKKVKMRGCEVWQVQSVVKVEGFKVKFYFSRSTNNISKEDFIKLANKEFISRFGFEPNFRTSDYKKRDGTPVDPFLKMVRNRWNSLSQRCKNGKYADEPSVKSNPQMISYKKRNINLEMTREEFFKFMFENRELHEAIVANGDFSSVDRIDETKGYTIDNIQLLALHKNIEKRYGKECERMSEERKKYASDKNKRQYNKEKNNGTR